MRPTLQKSLLFAGKRGPDGVIDLHTHILPGMDDGSPDAATSVQMLRQMERQGVCVVCASSHYYAHRETVGEFCARRQRAFAQLQSARGGCEGAVLTLLPAAEVAYFPRISEQKDLERLCIAGTRTLLLEMPFCEWNDFQRAEVAALTLDLGYRVVLVHPERFLFSANNRRQLEHLQQLPVGLQVNAGSLLRWRTRKAALRVLQGAVCPLLGSDCHGLTVRPPNLEGGRSVVQKKLGRDFWAQMQADARRLAGLASAAG